ncbi:hypothetical protein NKR19_g844 [Coniochaeta hoffmannii]|uniref:Uncharacterized protein n=1 Tax=Coniochaeta hoffmannii TaxID=91930 RepID=A0AA38SJK6_9PEZI|nr:hypothetical protein NKR19_g844 [Coniochaeta hoffmannii]
MRAYLAAKAEEEKRRQEEEKTRQARLRVEQRRIEQDMLQSSLQGGIPPPMVPVVFAGMVGGVLPQAAIDWAHQFVYAQSQQSHTPALLPAGQISASPRRDSQAQGYGPYTGSAGVPSTPGSAQGPATGYMPAYPGSPTRPRGQSMSAWPPRQPPGSSQHLPSLNTTFPGRAGGEGPPTQPGVPSAQQRDPQPSPSIYFHHWQPPTSQGSGKGSGTDQPGAASGESPKKRKATGPQPAAPAPSGGNPFQTSLSQPPPGRRGGHARQRSDLGSYRSAARFRQESFGPPSQSRASGSGSMREAGADAPSFSSQPQPQPQSQRSGAHSVSSLLADNPPSPQSTHYPPRGASDTGAQHSGGGRRGSPEEVAHGGASQQTHERQNND